MPRKRDDGLPTPSVFYDPLVLVLGQLSDFKANVPIHMEQAFFPTLREAGIDPERTDEGVLYPPKGSSHNPSLWRQFSLAYRYMKDSPNRGEGNIRVHQTKSKYYMLTEFGVKVAESLFEGENDDEEEEEFEEGQELVNDKEEESEEIQEPVDTQEGEVEDLTEESGENEPDEEDQDDSSPEDLTSDQELQVTELIDEVPSMDPPRELSNRNDAMQLVAPGIFFR